MKKIIITLLVAACAFLCCVLVSVSTGGLLPADVSTADAIEVSTENTATVIPTGTETADEGAVVPAGEAQPTSEAEPADTSETEPVPAEAPEPETAAEPATEPEPEEDPEAALEAEALKILKSMTLKQKVGQLFMVTPEAIKGTKTATKFSTKMKSTMTKYKLGGVIMFARNIKTPKQITTFNKKLNKTSLDYSGLPLFIAVDEEGGRVTRIASNPSFDEIHMKNMLAIGKKNKTSKAKYVGKTIGAYLKKYGFNVDLAPVADCFTNPKNTVIGDRSFGSDPDLVSRMVSAEIDGFHTQKVMTAIKHYPGHGDTQADTHKQTVKVTKSWAALKKVELKPFIYNLDKTDMIMASHIRCTGVSKGIAPASISQKMIQKKLRNTLGYDGVVITDSMAMKAISDKYTSAQAAIKALNAGCDIILCPVSLSSAYDGVLKAVKSGEISRERLDESVLRIIKLKLKYS